MWEPSKPHFCSAAGSLFHSAERGCQQETASLGRKKALSCLLSTSFSITGASLFNPVRPHLQRSTSLHPTLETSALPGCSSKPESPTHWPLLQAPEAEQQFTELLLQVQCFIQLRLLPARATSGTPASRAVQHSQQEPQKWGHCKLRCAVQIKDTLVSFFNTE